MISILRALILDYGEVLSLPQRRRRASPGWPPRLAVDRERSTQAYWRHRRDYDLRHAARPSTGEASLHDLGVISTRPSLER